MSKLEGNEFSPVDLFLPEFSPACGRAHNEFSPACGRVHNEFSPKNKNMLFYIRYLYIFGIRRSMFMFGIVIFQYYVIFVSYFQHRSSVLFHFLKSCGSSIYIHLIQSIRCSNSMIPIFSIVKFMLSLYLNYIGINSSWNANNGR
uniref:Uncharacterized protein n=1 Tax=Cacopsylla melanoneura TaxID=428564 RepID=A0A8D8S0Q3_9HEMI